MTAKRKPTRTQIKPIHRAGKCVGIKMLFATPLPILLVRDEDGDIQHVMVEPEFFRALEDRLRAVILATAQDTIPLSGLPR